MPQEKPDTTDLSQWELDAKDSLFTWTNGKYYLESRYENKVLKIQIYLEDSKCQDYKINTNTQLTIEDIRRISQEKLADTFNSW